MRTRLEINTDYSNSAAALGDRMYKQSLMSADIQTLQQHMHKLTIEKASDEVVEAPVLSPSLDPVKPALAAVPNASGT